MNPGTVRDKDGISASVEFLTMVGELAAAGRTLADRQNDFDALFGAFASAQVSLRVTDLSRIGQIMSALREQAPAEIGGVRVREVDDFIGGWQCDHMIQHHRHIAAQSFLDLDRSFG